MTCLDRDDDDGAASTLTPFASSFASSASFASFASDKLDGPHLSPRSRRQPQMEAHSPAGDSKLDLILQVQTHPTDLGYGATMPLREVRYLATERY